jgi:Effector-associated domain 11
MTDTDKAIQGIRKLLSEADTETALQETRQLMGVLQAEEAMIQLDMIQSEWYDVRTKTQHGLLSSDDQVRYNNITRAKLMTLLLQLGSDGDMAGRLASVAPAVPALETAAQNQAFKSGLKNAVGVLFFICALGTLINKDYISAACIGVSGVITFIPSLRALEKIIGRELLSWHKYAIVIGGLLLFGAYAPKKGGAVKPTVEEKAR